MKNVKVFCGLIAVLLLAGALRAAETGLSDGLATGPFTTGFRLIETSDASRSFPVSETDRAAARPIRIYLWYPAQPTAAAPMKFDDYVLLALGDFRPATLPVPLAKGLTPAALRDLRAAAVGAVRDAPAASGKFPVLVFGQGLFFESPVANFLLCEYLAAHGYVVAACPLRGTLTRLVNISVEDVETEVRDMEFAAAEAGRLPFADSGRTGVIGFDLGGMAGLLMAMRDLRVGAFLSLDSGILDRHYTGLPATHPQYREERFGVPWMHMTQARFVRPAADRSAKPSLFERKAYGPSYLVHVPTTNHGDFSSYGALGIAAVGPGYWSAPLGDGARPLYERLCAAVLAFFDASLKGERGGLDELVRAGAQPAGGTSFRIEHKEGRPAPPSEAALVNLIIEKGVADARPEIERLRESHAGATLIAENVLDWLGTHFLYWWGREDEAVGVFELEVFLYPGSWSAHASLGEAFAARGRTDEAVRCFKKALELDPKNEAVRAALEKLTAPVKKGNAG
jgi:Tetratricopeptide repeat